MQESSRKHIIESASSFWMSTVASNIENEFQKLIAGITNILGPDRQLHDLNEPSGAFIIGAHYAFNELTLETRRLQSQLLERFRQVTAILHALLRGESNEVVTNFDQNCSTVDDVLQQRLVWHKSTGAALIAVRRAFDAMLDGVHGLADLSEGLVILVPDTNALLHRSSIQSWSYAEMPGIEILLVPTVLAELDKLKIYHQNPDVRKKANSIIGQIKELRSRGRLTEGVTVIKNRIRLRAVATEPTPNEVLPWLHAASADDRILASCIEIMRSHSRSRVALVTGDINLQNKAEFALIPFLEPPNEALT